MSKKYANVIEGLNYILDIKQKDEMNLDFNLLSNLTYSILNMKITEDETPDETEEVSFVDEEEFDVLSSELTMLEEQLEESEDEKEEKKSKNDQQFLINQLSALFEKIQKMVWLRRVDD